LAFCAVEGSGKALVALKREKRADIQSLIEEGRSALDYAEGLGDGEFIAILDDGCSVIGGFVLLMRYVVVR
jgi:hypothetical protein